MSNADWLANLKVGDEVAVYLGDEARGVFRITDVAAAEFVVNGFGYSRNDGKGTDGGTSHKWSIRPVPRDIINRRALTELQRQVWQLACDIRDRSHEFDAATCKQVLSLLSGVAAAAKGPEQ